MTSIVTILRGLIRAFGVAIAVKFALALVVPHSGWIAAYYTNDQLQPPVRRSVEFSLPDATRIDRQLSFVDTEFPVHFFNEHGFNFGLRREATEPFSVRWRGYVHASGPLARFVTTRKVRCKSRSTARWRRRIQSRSAPAIT